MRKSSALAKRKRLLHPAYVIPVEAIERRIYLIRGHKVMLDQDLAELYGVTTGNLNLAVRRNRARFPEDFVFQLTREETDTLLLQIARANSRGGRRTAPYAFTEQGVAMLSSVLRSHRAALVNVAIMRAFVRFREVLATHKDLAQRLEALEAKYTRHDIEIERHNAEIQEVFEALRRLIEEPVPPQRRIGFARQS
jgi:chromosome segregation ATPase